MHHLLPYQPILISLARLNQLTIRPLATLVRLLRCHLAKQQVNSHQTADHHCRQLDWLARMDVAEFALQFGKLLLGNLPYQHGMAKLKDSLSHQEQPLDAPTQLNYRSGLVRKQTA